MRVLFFVFILFSFFTQSTSAQSVELAQQYYIDGEYEKAAVLFNELYQKNNRSDHYLELLAKCYIQLKQYPKLITLYESELNSKPNFVYFYVKIGQIYLLSNQKKEAESYFTRAIDLLPKNEYIITKVADEFDKLSKTDAAIATLEKGKTIIGIPNSFAYTLATYYGKEGNFKNMIFNYIEILNVNPGIYNSITTMIQQFVQSDEQYDEMLEQIYAIVQAGNQSPQLIHLLSWIYLQKKDFKNAMRQLKALSIQTNNNGFEVFNMADIMLKENKYEVAMDGFQFVIQKGISNSLFFDAERSYFECLIKNSVTSEVISGENQKIIDAEYTVFFQNYLQTGQCALIIYDYAFYLLNYKNDLESALKILQQEVENPSLEPRIKAQLKIRLADYTLIKGDRWEASLLYSQVDKDFKEDVLGQEARFNNAKLSYYLGDFDWAQEQFDVLKNATSRFISNDAIDLSVFIINNMGLDSTDTAMKLFASTELLIFRNQLDLALKMLDSINISFPDHNLSDDLLYAKAQIANKQKNFKEATVFYNLIIENYPDEIRADNALNELGELYLNVFKDNEAAMKCYEKLFTNYPSSVFALNARQKFRKLRGDDVIF